MYYAETRKNSEFKRQRQTRQLLASITPSVFQFKIGNVCFDSGGTWEHPTTGWKR